MKTNKLSSIIGIAITICGLLLIAILFVPMWRIDLDAPQYPEGLRLLIFANKLGGNIDIINGLNHYIGMKTLHVEDFVEFKILPYIIVAFAAAFIFVGISRRRKFMYILFSCFVLFGIVAMADFWKWEYDYGHNLNPEAAIIVPGMAYQPPLIGFKQLLNFGAYSIPDIGGWLFIVAGASLLVCILVDLKVGKKAVANSIKPALMVLFISLLSCNRGPEALKLGVDNCAFCQMTISNSRFGAEIVTKKGRYYKYDDIGCMKNAFGENQISKDDVKAIYGIDFAGNHQLINFENCYFMSAEAFRSPMGSNIASFSENDSLLIYMHDFQGVEIHREDILKNATQ